MNTSNLSRIWKNHNLLHGLILINVLVFIITLFIDPKSIGFRPDFFSFLSPGRNALLSLGASGTIPIDRLDHWWSPLTANYLHGSILHLTFNMAALWNLGQVSISMLGPQRMFLLYTIGGTLGFFTSYMVGTPLTAGASAAICSLAGGITFIDWQTNMLPFKQLLRSLSGWLLLLFLTGFVLPHVDNWAHIGGLFAGVLLSASIFRKPSATNGIIIELLAILCMALTLAALIYIFISRN